MIKQTHIATPEHTLTAYSDNAAVIEGVAARRYRPDPRTHEYRAEALVDSAFCIKVETHNHPTAIAPFPGARSEAHTSELQSLMRNSYAVFCLKTKTTAWSPSTSKTQQHQP